MERTGASKFAFVGNQRCLDFVNTEVISGGRRIELLEGYPDLAAWLIEAGVLEDRRVLESWSGTTAAEGAFEEALGLRGLLRQMVERLAEGRPIQAGALDEINRRLRRRPGHAQVVPVRGGFERRFEAELRGPGDLVALLAEEAAALLCEADLSLIKRCANPACILYFYDTTKNHARRWCSMEGCGNRMKVAAHYRRRRTSRSRK